MLVAKLLAFKPDLLGLVDEVVFDLILGLPPLHILVLTHLELVKVVLVHDASDEVAEPEHGRVLHSNRHLATLLVLEGVPHRSVDVKLVFLHLLRIVSECDELGDVLSVAIRVHLSSFVRNIDHQFFQEGPVRVDVTLDQGAILSC